MTEIKEESFQKAEVNSDKHCKGHKKKRSFWQMGIGDYRRRV